jgi:hypothetical protein
VAGTAALVWAAKPSLTSTQVASIIEQTATRPSGAGWNPSVGWGILNAKAAVESAAGRTAVDAVVLSKLAVSRPRLAGTRLQARVYARWNDGGRIVVGALPMCRISVGGTPVKAISFMSDGVVTCSFTLPRGSAGATVKGTIQVSAPGARPATASFRLAVRKR